MTGTPSPRPRFGTPFLVFGVAAMLAAVGALIELVYYSGNSALSPGTLGTTIGLVIAVVAFFAWGILAPANE
ncbi:MAG TPA: hypothetical protein VMG14_00990 [Thermoplasmata archaeon]|nr:hypothetical protein [Thermoplasmata archaeon]